MHYHYTAENIVYAWEQNYNKSLTVGDKEGLILMIAENLQKAAWHAQHTPEAIPHPGG